MVRRALGRGLEALLSEQADALVREVPLEQIAANPYQPRKQFDSEALAELSGSIKQYGVLQPLIVRQIANERYEIVAGERRFRAAQQANLKTVPAIVRTADAQQMLELALIENLQREDINPLDAARAYKKLSDEFALTHEQIGARLGKKRTAITNALRLLNLSQEAQVLLDVGSISEGHAKALLSVPSLPEQTTLLHEILDQALTVRQAERRARELALREPASSVKSVPASSPAPSPAPPRAKDAHLRAIEQRLSEFFGTRVTIASNASAGRIAIDFFNGEDLNRILDLLNL